MSSTKRPFKVIKRGSYLGTDPTMTTTLRRVFASKYNAVLDDGLQQILDQVVTRDEYNLFYISKLTFNTRPDAERKLKEFSQWLGTLFSNMFGKIQTGDSLKDGYFKGMKSVFGMLNRSKLFQKGLNFIDGAFSEFKDRAFKQSTLGLVIERVRRDLLGQLNRLQSNLEREFANLLSSGMSQKDFKKALTGLFQKAKDSAVVLTGDGIIRAYNEGSLDGMDALGIRIVSLEVELVTAGDENVCTLCEDAAGKYTLEEARGLLPIHPRCRCRFIPELDELPPGEQSQ